MIYYDVISELCHMINQCWQYSKSFVQTPRSGQVVRTNLVSNSSWQLIEILEFILIVKIDFVRIIFHFWQLKCLFASWEHPRKLAAPCVDSAKQFSMDFLRDNWHVYIIIRYVTGQIRYLTYYLQKYIDFLSERTSRYTNKKFFIK